LKERQLFSEMLREQLIKAQNGMKLYDGQKRTDRSFQVGEKVLLKLQMYAKNSVVNRPFPKLAFKFFGPYEILEKLGTSAYRLKLPHDSQVHHVFHVSQLKTFTPDYLLVFSRLPDVPALDVAELLPERILDRRLVKKGNVAITQVFVKWTQYPDSSATWEDYTVLRARFPTAAAWGQVASSEGGSVNTGV
jgi:hypothetical protein